MILSNKSAPVLAGLMWGFFRKGTFCTAETTFSQCFRERMLTTMLLLSISLASWNEYSCDGHTGLIGKLPLSGANGLPCEMEEL